MVKSYCEVDFIIVLLTGPQMHSACDDLLAHHNQHMGELRGGLDGDSDGEAVPRVSRINNACPQCGWLAQSWDEWIPW